MTIAREVVIRTLAEHHRRMDPRLLVYLSPHETEIRLVEVSPSVLSSLDHEVSPPVVAPMFPIPLGWVKEYVTWLVLNSPEEWSLHLEGKLPLPEGWATVTPVDP